MNAPPGVDSESSNEDVSPITSPSVSPQRAKFSLKSLFARPKPSTSTPAEQAEIDTSPVTSPRGQLQKLKQRVRILAGGDERPTSTKGDALPDDESSQAAEPDASFTAQEEKDPAATEMLTLLRKLVAKQQSERGTDSSSPFTSLQPSKSPKSTVAKPLRPPLSSTSHRNDSPQSLDSQPNVTTPDLGSRPGLNDTYFHPEHQEHNLRPPGQGYPSQPPPPSPLHVNAGNIRPRSPWQAWQSPQSYPANSSLGYNAPNYPPPMYPHPAGLQPWHPSYLPPPSPWYGHYPPYAYPPPATHSNGTQYSPQDAQGFPAQPMTRDAVGLSPRQPSPASPLPNPWSTHPPLRQGVQDRTANLPTGQTLNSALQTKNLLHRKPSLPAIRKDGKHKASQGDDIANSTRIRLQTPKATPDPFAGMLTTHEPDSRNDDAGFLPSEVLQPRADWSKALVSFAVCIDLAYSALRQARASSDEKSQMGVKLILELGKMLGSGKSIPEAWEDVMGEKGSGDLFAKELRVVAAFVADSKLDDHSDHIIHFLLSHSKVRDMLKGSPVAAYLTPATMDIVKDVATKWKDGNLSLTTILRSILAIRKELNHPTQKVQFGLLDQLAVLFSKQLKHRSAAQTTQVTPRPQAVHAGKRARTTTPRHPPPRTSARPEDYSSESAYSESDPGTPGTVESDIEADKMLAVADSGPAIVLEADSERRTGRPGRNQVKAAKEVLKC